MPREYPIFAESLQPIEGPLERCRTTERVTFSFTMITSSFRTCNGPFAASGHMVQNPPCWRASCPLGHPEQSDFIKTNLHFLCFGPVPVRSLLSSMADFVPCDRQLQRAHSRVKNLTLKLLDTCFIRISYYSGQSQPRRKQHNEPDSEFKANTCKPLLSAGKHVQCEQVTICFHSEGCLHGGRKILALGRSKKAEQLFVCFT